MSDIISTETELINDLKKLKNILKIIFLKI